MVRCNEVRAVRGWCLHQVVRQNSLEKLDLALQQPNVELHCEDRMGTTPLYSSLQLHRSDEFIMRLIQAGCDVNKSKDLSPLHWAINRSSTRVAQELIKRGVNVNAQNLYDETPLQYAVGQVNLDAVCLLLYYGADVSIPDIGGITPLMNSFRYRNDRISRLIFSISNDFSAVDSENQTVLHYALRAKSALAEELIHKGVDVNRVSTSGVFSLMFALENRNSRMFEMIWPRMDYAILLKTHYPFLATFFNNCQFPAKQWLKCLNLLLTSPVACLLAERFEVYHVCGMSFLGDLLFAFIGSQINLPDRIATINLLASLGVTLQIRDLDLTLRLCDFKEELQTLIYTGNFRCNNYELERLVPVTTFILAVEEDASAEFVFKLFCNQMKLTSNAHEIVTALEYFSMQVNMKKRLAELSKMRFDERSQRTIQEKLDRVPTVPSLLELSRNRLRKAIQLSQRVERPYQLFDVVENLELPRVLKDVLIFKVPPYRY